MKYIKRIIPILLVCAFIMGLATGCKKKDNNEEELSATSPVADISVLDYALIRSEDATDKLLDQTSELYGEMMLIAEGELVYTTDELEKGEEPDSEAKEILIGRTNRPETQEVLSGLSGSEYVIAVVGNKIVITGPSDTVTIEAIKYFIDTYFEGENAGKIPGDLYYKASADLARIIEGGKANYTLVCPEGVDAMYEDMRDMLFRLVKTISGVSLKVVNDEAPEDPNSYQILFGNTRYKETEAIKAVTSPEGYTIDFVGNKIVIFAWTGTAMEKAVSEFIDIVDSAFYEDDDMNANVFIMKEKLSSTKTGTAFYKDVPFKVNGRDVDSMFDAGDNALMLYWANATAEDYGAYTAELETLGFSKYQSLDNSSIVSATYTKDKAAVHVYYLKRTSELRVITQNDAVLPINSYDYEKVCDVAVTQLSLHYTSANPAGGMGYLIRLEDGTFVVIDGGHAETGNVENIYNLMLAQKPKEVEDIVISAWIITHPHVDHYGLYNKFAAAHANDVVVKYLVGNDTSDYFYESLGDGGDTRFIISEKSRSFAGCKYMKVHTGQQLVLPGITMTVQYTSEDVHPKYMFALNDATAVAFDLVVNATQTRFFFMADMCQAAAARAVEMYGEDLKSDVLQIGHHGNMKGGLEFVQYCAPDTVLWPAEENWATNNACIGQEQNKWLLENAKEIVYSYKGNYTFLFGEKVELEGAGSMDKNEDYTKFY